MPQQVSLTDKLKALRKRAGLDVPQLAELTNGVPATIYKAEAGKSVRLQSLREAYYALCRDEDEWTEVLLLWALAQEQGGLNAARAASTLRRLRGKIGEEAKKRAAGLLADVFGRLSPKDATLLTEFAEMFATAEPTRKMARVWLEQVRGVG